MPTFDRENLLLSSGYKIVCGVDEAGRGPLVGPVVAAIVSINNETLAKLSSMEETKLIKDSKKLSEAKREQLFSFIMENFTEIGIGICDHETIDRINILEATFLAMKKALGALKIKPELILVDGKFIIPNLSIKQEAIIHGDDIAISISAASIIAKVTRDRLMNDIHQKYPQYQFDKHKGYGTKIHMEAIQKYGPCPFHRKTFKPISNFITTS